MQKTDSIKFQKQTAILFSVTCVNW